MVSFKTYWYLWVWQPLFNMQRQEGTKALFLAKLHLLLVPSVCYCFCHLAASLVNMWKGMLCLGNWGKLTSGTSAFLHVARLPL